MQTATTTRDPLRIPAFLRRRRTARRRIEATSINPASPTPERPTGERWRNAERWTVFLQDEAPTIGCGMRTVWAVIDCGVVRLAEGHKRAQIRVATWLDLIRHGARIGGDRRQMELGI